MELSSFAILFSISSGHTFLSDNRFSSSDWAAFYFSSEEPLVLYSWSSLQKRWLILVFDFYKSLEQL